MKKRKGVFVRVARFFASKYIADLEYEVSRLNNILGIRDEDTAAAELAHRVEVDATTAELKVAQKDLAEITQEYTVRLRERTELFKERDAARAECERLKSLYETNSDDARANLAALHTHLNKALSSLSYLVQLNATVAPKAPVTPAE